MPQYRGMSGQRSRSGWVGEPGGGRVQGTFGIAFEMYIKKISKKKEKKSLPPKKAQDQMVLEQSSIRPSKTT